MNTDTVVSNNSNYIIETIVPPVIFMYPFIRTMQCLPFKANVDYHISKIDRMSVIRINTTVENLADERESNQRYLGLIVVYVTDRSGPRALPQRENGHYFVSNVLCSNHVEIMVQFWYCLQ